MNSHYYLLRYIQRSVIRFLIVGIGFINTAQAHYPHDIFEFVELSPD